MLAATWLAGTPDAGFGGQHREATMVIMEVDRVALASADGTPLTTANRPPPDALTIWARSGSGLSAGSSEQIHITKVAAKKLRDALVEHFKLENGG
jgi:hypothetical protein